MPRDWDRSIKVLLTCGMGEDCINKERPGTHRDHLDAERCVYQHDPAQRQRMLGLRQQRLGDLPEYFKKTL